MRTNIVKTPLSILIVERFYNCVAVIGLKNAFEDSNKLNDPALESCLCLGLGFKRVIPTCHDTYLSGDRSLG
jgi:hypothetical protein